MSGNTEFQRALNRYRQYREKALNLLRWYVFPWFKLRVIKGVLIGAHHGPLKGAHVTLNGWRSVKTDSQGRFAFFFVLRKINFLTVEWREAELIDWIKIDLSQQRVSKLKLKWPLLVRGELVDEQGLPLVQIPVAFNQNQITKTDAHGAFIFPIDSDLTEQSDQLTFQLLGHSFVHHFKANPQAHMLHRFMYTKDRGLFHLEDRASAQVQATLISSFNERIRWVLRASFVLIIFTLVLNFFVTKQQQTELELLSTHSSSTNPRDEQDEKQNKWRNAGVLERTSQSIDQSSAESSDESSDESGNEFSNESSEKNAHIVTRETSKQDHPQKYVRPSIFEGLSQQQRSNSSSKSSANLPAKPSSSSSSSQTVENHEDLEIFEEPMCRSMEFTYKNYYVPRGMEGILLSLVFGHWQSWRDDLSLFNGLSRHDQLQAGQRIKLKLPLHTWSIYEHQDEDSWQKLLELAHCQEAENLCRQLIQAWNPHVYLRRLKKRNQLLINLSLLQRRPYEGATLARIEGLRRGSVPKRRRPRVDIPKNCKILDYLSSDSL